MAWIELHQALWTHRKTLELADLLDLDETYAGAHLARLWTWALDNAPDGTIGKVSARVLAFGAGWKGDPQLFLEALLKSGWLDETEDGLSIHDWRAYAGKLIDRKRANTERMRVARAEHTVSNEDAHAEHVQRTESAREQHVSACVELPDLTGPNRTGPDQTQPPGSVPSNTPTVGSGEVPVVRPRPREAPSPRQLKPVPKPEPKPPNRYTQVLDAIREIDPEMPVAGLAARNAKAVGETNAEPRLIAEAYVAMIRGEWDDEFVRKRGSLHAVVDALGGYLNSRASPRPPPDRPQNGRYQSQPITKRAINHA